MKAKENGIDMVSLPSHTSHELQPLDKVCFKPFKMAFRAYRDVWNMKNQGMKCQKEDLAQWASLAFQKALTRKNIASGFRAIGIWPFNLQAMLPRTSPSESFRTEISEEQQSEEILEEGLPMVEGGITHYYGSAEEEEWEQEEEELESPRSTHPKKNHISEFLKLLKAMRSSRTINRVEPLIDYSQSQQLTSNGHISNLNSIATKKQALLHLKEDKQKERQKIRAKKLEEKEAKNIKRAQDMEARRLAKEQKKAQEAEKNEEGRRDKP